MVRRPIEPAAVYAVSNSWRAGNHRFAVKAGTRWIFMLRGIFRSGLHELFRGVPAIVDTGGHRDPLS